MVVWQNSPSTATPLDAANLSAAFAAKADLALVGAASGVATLDTGSHVPVAQLPDLSTLYATPAALAAAVAALQAQSASIEDLFQAVTLQTAGGAWSNTADSSSPLFSAPFPLTITSVALTFWAGSAIALSDSSYWRAVVRKANITNTVVTDIAYKTTRVTASSPYPAGQVWTNRIAWAFDSAAFVTPTLAANEMLYLATLPVGTPGTIAGQFVATIGYRPL